MIEHGAVAAFEEKTGLGLGAGITEQDPAAFGRELRLSLLHEVKDAVQLFKRNFLPNFDVGDELRITRPALAQLREHLALRLHDAQDLQRGHQSITGGGVITEDKVATLFAPEVEASFEHLVDHVLVAYRRAD